MQTKKLLVSTLILATLGGTLLQVSLYSLLIVQLILKAQQMTKSMVWELTLPTGTTMGTIGLK